MPKTETVYARLNARSYQDLLQLDETRNELNARLYEVLNDDFYMKKLTETVVKYHAEDLAPWIAYRKEPTALNRHEDIRAVGKFLVTDQKVDFVDIRFY